MAREISVRAEILRRFRLGHITLVQSYPNRSQPSSDVVPTGRPSGTIAEDGSWRFRQRQGRGTKWRYGNVQHFIFYCTDKCEQYLCCAFPGFVWNYQDVFTFSIIFLQCMTFGAKMLRVLLFLGWTYMNVARHEKAWYHYKDVCACWESMRLSTLHRLAISLNSIKTYLISQHGRASTSW